MKKFYYIIFNIIFIELIVQIFGQSTSKSFILPLNYSPEDNLYYIQLNSNKEIIPKNFIIDTTYSSTAFLCDNYNLTDLSNNSLDNNKIFINSKININNIINKHKNTIDEFITINTEIECILNKTDFFKDKILDERYGILGLNNGNNTLIDTLYNLQIIKEKIFSICLSKSNGYFGLGGNIGMDTYIENGQEINYINILSSENNLFELKINSIKINNIKFENEYIAILDTSKSHTYLPKNLYEQIVANLLYKNNNLEEDSELGFCALINEEEEINFYSNFQYIHLYFDNYIFIWKTKNYFYKYHTINEEHEIKLCFSFKELNDNDNSYDNNKIILGTDFMIDNEVIFDKNNQVIAFINTNCDSLLKENTDIENNNSMVNNLIEGKNKNNVNASIDDNEEEKENEIEKEKEEENEKLKEKEKKEENEKDKSKEKEKEKEKGKEIKQEVKEKEQENENKNEIKQEAKEKEQEKENKNEIKQEAKEKEQEQEQEKKKNSYKDLNNNSSNISETIDIISSDINDIFSDLDNNFDNNSINLSFSIDNLENIIENTTDEIINVNTTEKIIYNTTQLNQDIGREKAIETTKPTIKEETTIITEKIKIIPTTIINIPTTIIKNTPTTEAIENNNDINNNMNNSFSNNTEIEKNNLILDNDANTNKQPEKKNKFVELVKSFLKNKLIYFILAFIGVVLCLVAIIMFSCMIISCFKYCKRKRKDYVEQIDIEVQKYSKASSSYSG